MTDQTILVTGATGQQGGATALRLLADGWRVRALVRDSASPAAVRLAASGAELVTGDMTDRASLDAAVAGAYGVFSVQPADAPPHHDPGEVRMGVNVADAALAAGVRHLVYSSVGAVDRGHDIPHWTTKLEIERHIRAIGLPATVLRPVMFMENHATDLFGAYGEFALVKSIPDHMTVQLIAAADIGVFAALAFADPGTWLGEAVEIAGDRLTKAELVAAIENATGRPVPGGPLSERARELLRPGTDAAREGTSFGGWNADIPALRKRHPGLMDFATWLDREGAALLKDHAERS